MEFGMVLRLVSLVNLMLTFSSPVSIQGREGNLGDFTLKKKFLILKKTLMLTCV